MEQEARKRQMNTNYEPLIAEYLKEHVASGGSAKNPKYALKIFFAYLEEQGMNPFYFSVREANEFQRSLVTKTDDDGRITFTRASVLNLVGAVQSFYDYVKKRKMIGSNPFRAVKKVKRSKALPRNILNEQDMNTFLTHLRQFWKGENLHERKKLYKAHVVAELMYSTGARINEVMKLRVSDIDFTRNMARLIDSKTGKARDGIVNEYAAAVLRVYIDTMRECVLSGKGDPRLLFGAKTNLKIFLNGFLNAESVRLGLGKFTTHHFRHAVGFHLLRAGCDIRYIKEILGHEDLGTTQVYTKVDKLDLKNVIDAFHPRKVTSIELRVTNGENPTPGTRHSTLS
jgi:site-specific recombinase XerD